MSEIVEFLVALHSLSPLGLDGLALPDEAALSRRRDADIAIVRRIVTTRWSAADVGRFEEWVESTLTALRQPAAPVLVHGDFWFGNLRVEGRRLHGVLDWEEAAVADPSSDIAPCLYLGPRQFDEVAAEYARRRSLDYHSLRRRAVAICQARELSGIRACVSADDSEELEDELSKLRQHL